MKSQKTPLRVLLTDDDKDDRLIFNEILNEISMDITIHMVSDGKQMMDFLSTNENQLPDIIFLDLNMPNMNGIECLKEIRSHDQYSNISIAIYSTSTSENDIDDTFNHGANIYITKPAAYGDLKKVLKKSLTAIRLNRNPGFEMSNFVLKI